MFCLADPQKAVVTHPFVFSPFLPCFKAVVFRALFYYRPNVCNFPAFSPSLSAQGFSVVVCFSVIIYSVKLTFIFNLSRIAEVVQIWSARVCYESAGKLKSIRNGEMF